MADQLRSGWHGRHTKAHAPIGTRLHHLRPCDDLIVPLGRSISTVLHASRHIRGRATAVRPRGVGDGPGCPRHMLMTMMARQCRSTCSPTDGTAALCSPLRRNGSNVRSAPPPKSALNVRPQCPTDLLGLRGGVQVGSAGDQLALAALTEGAGLPASQDTREREREQNDMIVTRPGMTLLQSGRQSVRPDERTEVGMREATTEAP